MKKLFIGMLFVLIDLKFGNNLRIGLIPDFLGYFFIFQGLKELSDFSERFTRIKPHVVVMIVYSAFLYALDLFGASFSTGFPLSAVLELPSTVMWIYITYNIVTGVKDIEIVRERDLNFRRLYATWKIQLALSIITHLLSLVPVPVLTLISAVLGFATAIYFLYVFNISKRLFYENAPVA